MPYTSTKKASAMPTPVSKKAKLEETGWQTGILGVITFIVLMALQTLGVTDFSDEAAAAPGILITASGLWYRAKRFADEAQAFREMGKELVEDLWNDPSPPPNEPPAMPSSGDRAL